MACAHRSLCRDRGRHNRSDDRLVHRRCAGRSGSRPLHAELWLQITLFFAVSVVLLAAHETGAVRLSGVEWTARSADGSPVAVGTVVRIDAIEGVKLIVTPVPVSHK